MKNRSKLELKDITFCIPIRIESFYRIQNLNTLLRYLDIHFDTNYIVLEADNNKHFKEDINIQNLKYIFTKDDDIIFHRTKYINQMLNEVCTPYAAIWDTDAITPVGQIKEAYSVLQNSNNTLVYPFSGCFISLNELISKHFSKTLDIECIMETSIPNFYPYGFYSVGGAYMINVRKYLQAGGENEYFYGWGPEDAERNARIQILELGTDKIEGPMYHLFHTRGVNSRYPDEEKAKMNNITEFCKICGMATSELYNYIQTWPWCRTSLK